LNELISITGNLLVAAGQLFLLLPYKRLSEAETLLTNSGFCITDTVLVRQTTAHAYFRVMIAAEHNRNRGNKKGTNSEIAIKDNQGNYTAEFISLLKDYYLYL
jgi:tRNA1Val (adenine37-N6)-methyltransferase